MSYKVDEVVYFEDIEKIDRLIFELASTIKDMYKIDVDFYAMEQSELFTHIFNEVHECLTHEAKEQNGVD